MKVTGTKARDLILRGKAPAGMIVSGTLDLAYCEIKKLPVGLQVLGSLDLGHSQIEEIPSDLQVSGWLSLISTQIKVLPAGMKIRSALDLAGTQIKELPSDLTVEGSLYLDNSQIKELPTGLKVGGLLSLVFSQIKSFLPQRGSQNGKSGMVLAVEDYTLVAHDDGTVSAGCQKLNSIDDALVHWNRDDLRAKLFTIALQKFQEEKLVAA